MSARDGLARYIGYEPDEHDEEFERRADAFRAEVLTEAADEADQIAQSKLSFGELLSGRGARDVARRIRRMATAGQPGKDTGGQTAGEPTPSAPGSATTETCGQCRRPFDEADTRWDGRARYGDTPFCRACVDHCHDTEIADHRCLICAKGGDPR